MANARHQGQGGEPDKSATVDTGVAEAGAAPSGTEAAWTRPNGSPSRCASGRQAGAAAASGPAAALDESERLARQMREGGREAGAAAASGAAATLRSGADVAQGVQELTTAWARYAEEIMRQTSEASRALLNCRSFGEMLEVQAQLLRGNLQTFLDQSGKIADIAGRMAARPCRHCPRAADSAGGEPGRRRRRAGAALPSLRPRRALDRAAERRRHERGRG